MILGEIPSSRVAIICDHDGNILWNSVRDNTTSFLTLDETKESLKRSIGSWDKRNELFSKIGDGKYAIVAYKVDCIYDKGSDSGIKYDDSSINIDWELDKNQIILSDKDKSLQYL